MQLSPGTSGRHRPQVPRLLGLLDVTWITWPQHEAIETGPESVWALSSWPTPAAPRDSGTWPCSRHPQSLWRGWKEWLEALGIPFPEPVQLPAGILGTRSVPPASDSPLPHLPFISSASRGAGLRAGAVGATGEERDKQGHNLGCGHTFSYSNLGSIEVSTKLPPLIALGLPSDQPGVRDSCH